MTYAPRTYWEKRANQQGPHYVGPGGRETLSLRQAERFRALIRSHGPRGHVVLDFGCGPGRLAREVARKADHYVGVDISRTAIRTARRAAPDLQFTWLPDDALPIGTASVAAVYAVTVFQHIVDEAEWLLWTGEIRRVLRSDGTAFVIDALHTGAPTAAHVKTRPPEVLEAALGLKAHEIETTPDHWVGVLR